MCKKCDGTKKGIALANTFAGVKELTPREERRKKARALAKQLKRDAKPIN